MMGTWRLINIGLLSAAENMAWDETLLQLRADGRISNTVRFLRFHPCALVGYHQAASEEIDLDFARSRGIEINRRLTGGGAIYFEPEHLGWEVICRAADLGGGGWEELTRAIAEAAARGLSSLGLEAKFRPRNDIEVGGRKISGTGGVFEGEALLFQGTVLTTLNMENFLRLLKVPLEKLSDKEIRSIRERVTTLKQELGEIPSLEKIQAALLSGFATLGIRPERREPGPQEQAFFTRRLPYYRSDEWIHQRSSPSRSVSGAAVAKLSGGLIRVSLRSDSERKILKEVFITGDFFVRPLRLVYDLEAWLRNTPLPELNQRFFEFFDKNSFAALSLSPEDFYRVLGQAIENSRREVSTRHE